MRGGAIKVASFFRAIFRCQVNPANIKDEILPLLRTRTGHLKRAPNYKKSVVKIETEVITLKRKGNKAGGILVFWVKECRKQWLTISSRARNKVQLNCVSKRTKSFVKASRKACDDVGTSVKRKIVSEKWFFAAKASRRS